MKEVKIIGVLRSTSLKQIAFTDCPFCGKELCLDVALYKACGKKCECGALLVGGKAEKIFKEEEEK